jgi:predicted transposase/invertase (TIGR01784 family)
MSGQSVLLDIVFKYLLGARESTPLLTDFINAVERASGFPEVEDVIIQNPFDEENFFGSDPSVIDVLAKDKEGGEYIIQVRIRYEADYPERSLYYWALKYAGQIKAGEGCRALKSVVTINIFPFLCFPKEIPWHSCFLLREKTDPEYVLTLDQIIHFIETSKMNARTDSELARWIYLFNHLGEIGNDTLDEILESTSVFRELGKRHKKFSRNEQAKMAALSRKMFLHDRASIPKTETP